jgi:hypothetical protein
VARRRASTIPAASSIPLSGGGDGGGSGGTGGRGGGGDGWAGDGSGDGADDADGKNEAFLSLAAASAAAAAAGAALPPEFAAAAASGGLRASALRSYLHLLSHASPLTVALAKALPAVRARLLRDPRYLFKVGAEVAIDAGCATVAEVRKRGPEFWDEFEFYLSDLLVGCVLDVVLVTLMAPAAVLGRGGPRPGSIAARSPRLAAALARVPSAVLEASPPGGPRYSPAARAACLGVKFGEYSLAGMACGAVGQAVANGLMAVKRAVSESRARAAGAPPPHPGLTPPPVGLTALTWGLFMGASSNVRYQVVYGLERAVDSTLAKSFPPAAYAATLAFRFANNVIGGENFIDMARWTGIQ